MASAASQRVRALALYRQLLRTSSKTFEGDQRLILAFREKARSQFQVNANETDAQKIEESLAMGEDVVKVLRQNVVQGKWKEDAQAYRKLTQANLHEGLHGGMLTLDFSQSCE